MRIEDVSAQIVQDRVWEIIKAFRSGHVRGEEFCDVVSRLDSEERQRILGALLSQVKM